MKDSDFKQGESRWLWQTKRLFPHPLFAGCISFACVLVTLLLVGVGITKRTWPMVAISVAFLVLAYATCRAAISLWKERHEATEEPATQPPSKPTYAIMVLLIGLYSWLLTLSMHLFGGLFKNGPGSVKYFVTLCIAILSTLFMQVRGKQIVRSHFGPDGGRNLHLNARQAGYVCLLIVCLSIYLVWVLS